MTATLALPGPFPVDTIADLLDQLGGISASRVRWVPTPGTATEVDAIAADQRFGRLCELVDGTLVEKPRGFYESLVAIVIARLLGNFVAPRRLGVVGGEQGMMRVVPGQIRMPAVSFTSWARLPADYRANAAPRVSPDLAVEVLRPTNTAWSGSSTRRRGRSPFTRLASPSRRCTATVTSSPAATSCPASRWSSPTSSPRPTRRRRGDRPTPYVAHRGEGSPRSGRPVGALCCV